jgi:malonyl-ACP O-methyltransferase BioC
MLSKKEIKKNFSSATTYYDQEALVQKSAALQLNKYLAPFIKNNDKILDLGSGSSFLAKNLCNSYANFNLKIYEIDLAQNMLNHWHNRPSNITPICGDFENFDFQGEKFDIIISSFALQWVKDFENFSKKIRQILKPGGMFIFCLPFDGSLSELIDASIESGCNFSFLPFPKINLLESSLIKNGFDLELLELENKLEFFDDALSAIKKIKKIGANYSLSSKKFINKKNLTDFNSFYLKNSLKKAKNPSISWNIAYIGAVAN